MAQILGTTRDGAAADGLTLIQREAPYNLEAEQALLGALLANNEAIHQLNRRLNAQCFYAGIHQRLFDAILKFNDKGLVANPVTLKHHFHKEDGIEDQYLARLVAASVNTVHVRDYCEVLLDLAMKRSLIEIGQDVVARAFDPKEESPGIELVEEAEQHLFNLASDGSNEGGFKSLRISMANAIERTEAAYKRDGKVVGVSCGLKDVDQLLGGLQHSDLLILAGRPSMGKTALATNMAFNAAKWLMIEDDARIKAGEKPRSVGFFSLEMSAEQLANRILASACSINSSKLMRGELNNDEFAELVRRSQELASMPFHIDDTPALSIASLRARARRLKRVHNVGLLIVDYLQLVRPSATKSSANRVQEISEITQGLKAIAKELNVPVIALSQLSRAVEQREDKRPQLSDLRESGSIEQDADVVMFVFREEYYLARTEPEAGTEAHMRWQEKMERVHGLADLIVAKQRNGPIDTVTLEFQSSLTLFKDLPEDRAVPEYVGY